MAPKFLAYLVILCFERHCPKLNSLLLRQCPKLNNTVTRLKSMYLPPKNFRLAVLLSNNAQPRLHGRGYSCERK